LAFYISRALSLFGMVISHLPRPTIAEELIAARKRFEASNEYPSGSSRSGA
jgi:hypothetical protein